MSDLKSDQVHISSSVQESRRRFFATIRISNNESTVTRTICGLPDVIETGIYQEGSYTTGLQISHT